jgi:WD40 repeat protein
MTKVKARALAILVCVSVGIPFLVLGASATLQQARAQEKKEQLRSLQSYNFPKAFIRHRDGLGFATEISSELDRKQASWYVCPGLAGGDTISFRSLDFPNQYLRHQDGRLKLHDFQDADLFKKDASYKRVNGLAKDGGTSFESVNFPDCFIRHKAGEIWVEKNNGTEAFAKDATFRLVDSLTEDKVAAHRKTAEKGDVEAGHQDAKKKVAERAVGTAGAADAPFRLTQQGENDAYGQISISPDGSRILGCGLGYVHLWDVAGKTVIDLKPIVGDVVHVAFCQGGKIATMGNDREKTFAIELPSAKVLAEFKGTLEKVQAKDGDVVITYVSENSKYTYSVWQASTGKEIMRFTPNKSVSSDLKLTPDGKLLGFFDDVDLRLFDLTTGKERLGLPGMQNVSIRSGPTLSPDGKRLALSKGNEIAVYDISDAANRPKLLWRTNGGRGPGTNPGLVSGCVFSPDSRTLNVQSSGQFVLLDVGTQKRSDLVNGYRPLYTADGRTLVMEGQKTGALVVANADGSTRTVINVPEVKYLHLAERGNKLAMLDKHGELYVVPFDASGANAVAVKEIASFRLPADALIETRTDSEYESVEFSPDGKRLVVTDSRARPRGTRLGWLGAWDISSGKLVLSTQIAHPGAWTFLPDGLFAWGLNPEQRRAFSFVNFKTQKVDTSRYSQGRAAEVKAVAEKLKDLFYAQTMRATHDGKAIFAEIGPGPTDVAVPGLRPQEKTGAPVFALIDSTNYKITAEWRPNLGFGPRISFSPDGKLVARSDRGRGCKFWELATQKEVPTDAARSDRGMDFADSGKLFCTIGGSLLNVYELESGVKIKEITTTDGHSGDVTAVAVSPVGKLFVTCGSQGEVQIRDLDTGASKRRINAHKGPILAAAISPDGKALATLGGEDRLVKLWALDGGK